MQPVHEWIYQLEEGFGPRILKVILVLLFLPVLAAFYDFRTYQTLSQIEVMDQAQLARNISEGRGFTTKMIRPFALYLFENQALKTKKIGAPVYRTATNATLSSESQQASKWIWENPLPEISNPPVYPYLLAGIIQLPPVKKSFNKPASHKLFQPEIAIIIFSQMLFVALMFQVYFLARRIFNQIVAWYSVILMVACETLWRLSALGLSTMFIMVFVLMVVWCIVRLEECMENHAFTVTRQFGLAGVIGLLLGIMALTRYSCACLVIPVVVYLYLLPVKYRMGLCVAMVLAFALLFAPWLLRNYFLCGTFFGTASFAISEGTSAFPDATLMRSLIPNLGLISQGDIPNKFGKSLATSIVSDLPRVGGSWGAAMFWLGLLIPSANIHLHRLRIFLLTSILILAGAQALNRSFLSSDSLEYSPENLLVIMLPVAFIFSAIALFQFLKDYRPTATAAKGVITLCFFSVAAAPLILVLARSQWAPGELPTYRAPAVQTISSWLKPDELMISDIPWAVAWYGNRNCIWLPKDLNPDFNALYKLHPIKGMYLTERSLDKKALSNWFTGENKGWGGFIAYILFNRQLPKDFPLNKVYNGLFPYQIFLSDTEVWKVPKK